MLKRVSAIGLVIAAQAVAFCCVAWGQAATASTYPKMFPLEQYLMDQNAEIALAKSAGPKAIADQAEVLVLGREGYTTAVKGSNGFVCLVERGWTAPIGDPNFWNPKLRGPLCLNAQGAQGYLPITIEKTKLVLAGKSKEEMFAEVGAKLDKKELPGLQPGAMCYMLSKDSNLGDGNGHWHPHLMFFVPLDGNTWGGGVDGSPIIEQKDPQDRLTVLMVPVRKWSDGTADM